MYQILDQQTKIGRVILVGIEAGEPADKLPTLANPFICGIDLGDDWQFDWLHSVVTHIISRGGVCLSFRGKNCEEAHDVADLVRRELLCETDDNFVMTTWENKTSVVDFLWDLSLAMPSQGYVLKTEGYLIISVGSFERADSMLAAIREVFT